MTVIFNNKPVHYQFAKKLNKFGAKKQVYNGIKYDSGREAQEAFELEILQKKGIIKEIIRQVTIPLYINGIKICSYRADFVLYYPDGLIQIREVKGMIMNIFMIKWKMLEAILKKNSPDREKIYEAIGYKGPDKHRIEMVIIR